MSAATWLQEAWETGNALAPLPTEIAPATAEAAMEQAAALAEALGHPVTGVRLARGPSGGWISGPLLEPRLLRAGTPVSLDTQRRPRLSAAVVAVLAEPTGDGAPVLSALHPALDLASTRFRDGPATDAEAIADLAGLGLVLVGKRAAPPAPDQAESRLGRSGTRPRPIQDPLGRLLHQAAEAAQRWGGLPAGALLVVSGLGEPTTPQPGEKWHAAVSGVGRISTTFG